MALKGKSDIGDRINTQVIQPPIDANIDAELAELEARRGKNLTLKQAMVREFLTGRMHLVIQSTCGDPAC